ncbi:MAG: LysR substrate-binding domain-containing protein [Burkholderiales bacterium]
MRVFIAVAEAGELADAGNRIGRTPAALSMTLKQIEEELGGALFQGERKGRLTPLGGYVLAQARRAVAEFDGALQHIRHYASGGLGLVQVAAVPSAATRLIPSAVERLRKRRPDVRVDLRDIDSSAVVEAVAAGVVDFGIATLSGEVRGVVAELLLQDPFRLVCPVRHRLAALGRPVRWKDIEPREFIANGLCARISAPEVANLVARSLLTLRNTTSLLTFVEQGFGVTLLPALAAPSAGTLCSLPLADRGAIRRLDLLTRRGETLNPAATALMQIIRETTAQESAQSRR